MFKGLNFYKLRRLKFEKISLRYLAVKVYFVKTIEFSQSNGTIQNKEMFQIMNLNCVA